jgi:hypothetical protein
MAQVTLTLHVDARRYERSLRFAAWVARVWSWPRVGDALAWVLTWPWLVRLLVRVRVA